MGSRRWEGRLGPCGCTDPRDTGWRQLAHEPKGPPIRAAKHNPASFASCTLPSGQEPKLLVPSLRSFCKRVRKLEEIRQSAEVSELLRARPPGVPPHGSHITTQHWRLLLPHLLSLFTLALVQALSALLSGRTAAQLAFQSGSPQILQAVRVSLTACDSPLQGQRPCSQNIPQGPCALPTTSQVLRPPATSTLQLYPPFSLSPEATLQAASPLTPLL